MHSLEPGQLFSLVYSVTTKKNSLQISVKHTGMYILNLGTTFLHVTAVNNKTNVGKLSQLLLAQQETLKVLTETRMQRCNCWKWQISPSHVTVFIWSHSVTHPDKCNVYISSCCKNAAGRKSAKCCKPKFLILSAAGSLFSNCSI